MMHIGPYCILKARARINQIALFVTTAFSKHMSAVHRLCELALLKYLLQIILLDGLRITMAMMYCAIYTYYSHIFRVRNWIQTVQSWMIDEQ